MSDKLTIRIEGLPELKKSLKEFPFLKQAKLLRNANRKAARMVVIRRLNGANTHSGRKFGKRSKKRPFGRDYKKPFIVTNVKGNKTAVIAGTSSSFFHYRFAEYGTKERTTYYRAKLWNRKRKTEHKRLSRVASKLNRGKMPITRPFIERILDNSVSPLFRYLKTEYKKDLDKAILSMRKRANKIKP